MSDEAFFPYPLVSTGWLADRLGAPDVKPVDGSWRLADAPPAAADYELRHIPGAVFFDLDAVADRTSALPHMLPAPADFATAVGALGIRSSDRVVVYDDSGLFSAARVWWTFRAMGHEHVSVLEGGLPKWRKEDRPLESGWTAPTPVAYEPAAPRPIVRSADEVRAFVERREGVLLDARPAARFRGEAPEPRPGLRRGRIPGAVSLPHSSLLDESGALRPLHELAALFRDRGVHGETAVIASCGSGVTAAVLALALERLGHRRHALYDGSWAEWGAEQNDPERFPVATG
jgi:thiosulfate/3-mercaptopyruvate sulfurtransferase